jgi:hypothetical protein
MEGNKSEVMVEQTPIISGYQPTTMLLIPEQTRVRTQVTVWLGTTASGDSLH